MKYIRFYTYTCAWLKILLVLFSLSISVAYSSENHNLATKKSRFLLLPAIVGLPESDQRTLIRGKILDESRRPISGATIKSKITGIIAHSDAVGNFEIPSVKGDQLTISYVGFETVHYPLRNIQERIEINMQVLQNSLEETVVVAYGRSKAKDITGSLTRLTEADLKNAPMGANIQSLLQGRAAGVNVAIQSASPTSPVSVIIRGASSLTGNNQPLWVIDGVPDYSNNTSGNVANTLYNLNLEDVESVDILKDASATALYGSRASNGVVLVTTKKGKQGQVPTIEVSSRLGLQTQNFNEYSYFDAPQYIDFADRAAREEVISRGAFDYFTRLYLDEQAFFKLRTSEYDQSDLRILPGAYYDGNTNWLKEMTQSPWNHTHTLSLRGGTQDVVYYVSLNNQNYYGVIQSGKNRLYGGRANLEARIRKGIKFGLQINASSRNTDDKDYMLNVIKKIRPDIPVYNEDGTLFTRDPYTENPYTTLLNTQNGENKNFNATTFLEVNFWEHFLLRTAYTANYINNESLRYMRRGSTFNYDGSRNWQYQKTNSQVWENTLNYSRQHGDHDILALLGYSFEKTGLTSFGMAASNFPDDDILNNFSSGANRGALTEDYTAYALVSQFSRLQYKFKDRYIIGGSLRRDGSSRFGPNNRWGIFPSGSVAYLIHEESFFKNTAVKDKISYLKLRGSIGTAGSQNLGNYGWQTYIGSARYNESPAISPSSIGNLELKWEETKMVDVGLDFGLFRERLRGSFGYYSKKSDDLIYSKPLPTSSSFSTISSNVASIKNEGLEFDIRYDIIKRPDFTLTADANIASNKGKVLKINGTASELNFGNIVVKEGERTGQWFGYETYNRLFVTQEEIIALQGTSATGAKQYYRSAQESIGDLYFKDQNGDGIINTEDKVFLGSAEPKYFGGFGLTAIYKNFYANATFTYAYGQKRLWSMPLEDVGYVGNYNHSNKIAGQSATLLDPYSATIPRMTQYGDGANGTFSDFWLYDASYIRLSALNLSYRIPQKSLANSLVQGIDLTFQATNLLTFTSYPGFDPQGNWSSSSIGTGMGTDNSAYPAARTFNLGVKLTFR
ncbi:MULTISPECIES: SusC/RagA family TonB-linked outer membrane protein [unclassified Sphingobacterium]|uniref:SusC/RagA family TonB-linked outer membrane protein n=1 Tax=unclassified Sphingobacterium TaxID=2609468 RepID=UPI0025E620F3|nr:MULTISPECIES: SusC/RagA family TonB-linked outer membrane protein [unclassified Sphingobacterium]